MERFLVFVLVEDLVEIAVAEDNPSTQGPDAVSDQSNAQNTVEGPRR